MDNKFKVVLALTTCMVLWGISFIWSEQALKTYNPLSLVLSRLIISVALLFFLNLWLKKIKRISKHDFISFILLAFLQPFAYFVGENYGIIYSDSVTTSVVIATIPLFSPVAAYFFLKEKISLINFFGIIISVVGVFLVIINENFSLLINPFGILLLFLAVISAVLYSVLAVKLAKKYNIYTILAFQNIFGIAWFIPAFLIFDLKSFLNTGFVLNAFIPIVLLAVFGSTICYLLFLFGVKKLGITRANIFSNSIPVFTTIFALILLNRTFYMINFVGIILVLSGVTVTQINKLSLKNSLNGVVNKIKNRIIFPKS
jgi:drug/metabolite transporter (DMT)-like permease